MITDKDEQLIWSCIQPADNRLTPEKSDGYNEGEVYSALVRLLESDEYQKMAAESTLWRQYKDEAESLQKKLSTQYEKVEKWDKVQEVLDGYRLEIHYPGGKSITVVEQQK